MRELVNVHFPSAEKIRVILDNLNTHSPSSLYEAFEPAEARRIREFAGASLYAQTWLLARVLVEIELSVLVNQCLKQRIPDRYTLQCESTAWETIRNAQKATVNWRFGVTDARVKLERLYPKIQS
jgi:hypothetical protein